MATSDVEEGTGSVSLPVEIWTMIAELIPSVDALRNLSLVSHKYRDMFLPFLHASLTLQLDKLTASKLSAKTLPSTLHYTKAFEVFISSDSTDDKSTDFFDPQSINEYSKYLAKMLERMPYLRSFRWVDHTFDEQFRPALMLKTRALRNALSGCSTLQELSLQFACLSLEYDSEFQREANNCMISLRPFKNLTSLELYGIHAKTPQLLVRGLADALGANPHLKKLGLGRTCDVDYMDDPATLIWRGPDFMQLLCQRYESHCKAAPLALETLRLGHGTFMYKFGKATSGAYLSKLVDFTGLKNFHVFNGMASDAWEPEPMELDWTFLNGCSLRQLVLTRLEIDARKWLNKHGQSVEELIVTDHFSMYDDSLNNFGALKLPNLSMIFTQEVNAASSVYDFDYRWGNDVDWDSDDSDTMDEMMVKGPSPQMDKKLITVLDRLRDGGRKLTRLGICFNFETQWSQFAKHLPNLSLLKQLRIDKRSQCQELIPSSASSLWPGITRPSQLARRYAKLMKSLCPSLQYIQIGHSAYFEVTSPLEMVFGIDIQEQIQLRELDFSEILAIPLFAMGNFTTQSGLSGPEYYYEPISEDDEEYLELEAKIFYQAFSEHRDPQEALRQAYEAGAFPKTRKARQEEISEWAKPK